MIVTVNTDASFSHQYKVGAYAFWIVCNQGKFMHCGPLKETINSTDAELRCIANALHVLLKSEFIGITKIIINSDAKTAFSAISSKAKPKSPAEHCFCLLQSLIKKYCGSTYEFRHVKGHSGTNEKRKWVNDWCDKKAKEQMRLLVKTKISS